MGLPIAKYIGVYLISEGQRAPTKGPKMKTWIVKVSPSEIIAVASSEAKAYEALEAYRLETGKLVVSPKIETWTVDSWEK